jgi:putative colanic acid biosynthesis UDP-glucose lipid carrier transferase
MTTLRFRIQQHWSLLGSFYRVLDLVSVAGGLALTAWWCRHALEPLFLLGALSLVIFLVVSEFTGLYRSWRGVSADREFIQVVLTWAITVFLLLAAGYLTAALQQTARRVLVLWVTSTPVLVCLSHSFLRFWQRSLRAHGINTRKFAIVGINELGFQLAKNIEESPEMGLRLAGFYDDRPADRIPEIPAGLSTKVGGLTDLVGDAKAGFVDRIYITLPMRGEDRIRKILTKLADTTAAVYIVPDFFVFQLLHSRWTDVGGVPAVSVFENPLYGVDGVCKRIFDLVTGSLLLLVLGLPMLLIAVAIKVTSRGPVFFRQLRYGLDGKEIFVWKFRSMRVMENDSKVTQATKNDPRVTPLGAVLRRTSLDELPQLFNVLEGTMSLVGPRPHATAHNEQYRKEIEGYMLRHKIKPGITGWAQVNGYRGETDTLDKMQKRVEFDHQYIREWSLWLDIKILIRTVFVVLSRQNAY